MDGNKQLHACNVPLNLHFVEWDKVAEVNRQALTKYRSNLAVNVAQGAGLYLWGDYGRGKSAIAALLCREWIQAARQPCYWIRHHEWPTLVIEKTQLDELYTIAQWCEIVPLLVVDEFSIRDKVAFTETALEELVRRRIDARKCTIITSNVAPAELKLRYPALHAVLAEAVRGTKIQGPDFRVSILLANQDRYI